MDHDGVAAPPLRTIDVIAETLTRLEKTVDGLAAQFSELDGRVSKSVTREEMKAEMLTVQEANQAQIASVDTSVNNSLAGLADQIAQMGRSQRINNEEHKRTLDNYTKDQAAVFAQFRADLKKENSEQWEKLQAKVQQSFANNESSIKTQDIRLDTQLQRIAVLERMDAEGRKEYAQIREEQREQRGILANLQVDISDFLIRIVPVTDAVLGNDKMGMSPLRAEFEIVNKRVDEIKWIGRGGVVTVLVLVIAKLLGIDLGGVI